MTTQSRHRFLKTACFIAAVLLISSCGSAEHADDPAVKGQHDARAVAVTLVQAATIEVRDELFSVGRIVSRNAPVLAAEINARVVDVLVEEGEPVGRGQLMIQLDTTAFELARREAQAEIERLKVSIANEERRVSRYRDLKTRDMMPQERLDDAEAKLAVDKASLTAAEARLAIARDRLSKAELLSPVDGVVERRHVSVGDYVQVGGPLFTVTDIVNLRVELPFPETVGHRLRIGQVMHVESAIAPGLVVEAHIDQIRPQVGPMSRSVVVIANITNPGNWRPEATVEAFLVTEVRPDSIVVPLSSVVKRPAGDVLYRLESRSSQQVRQVVVQPGVRQNGWIEIRQGIHPGDLIVVEGAQYLTDGAPVLVQETAP